MRSRFVLLSILSLLVSFPGHSQNSTFINYGTAEGLNHTQLFDITQDDFGGLWLMPYSSSTIYRFDGAKFERLLLKVPGVESVIKPFQVVADGKKRVLFLTNVGVVEFDGTEFKAMTSKETLTPSLSSVLYVDSRSTVWVIDQAGSLFYQPDVKPEIEKRNLKANGRPLGFFEYENELMLFTSEGEIVSLASGERTVIPWLKSFEGFYRITQDGSDYYIFFKDRIVRHDSKSASHKEINTGPVVLTRRAQIISDEDKNLWLLTGGKVVRIDKDGPHVMDGKAGFTFGFVHRMFKDRYNTLWFGTDSEGLYHYIANQPLAFYTNGAPVFTLLPVDENQLLCGTAAGGVMSITSGKGCLEGPLYKELSSKNVTALTRGPGDDLLAGTVTAGMFRVDKKGRLSSIPINSKVGASSIYQIAHDDASYWALSRVGLHNFDLQVRHRKSYALFSDLGIGSEVNFIYPLDTSSLLLGSSGNGLFRFYPAAGNVVTVPNFKKASVLYSMKQDDQKRYWFCGEFPFLQVLSESFELVKEIDLSKYCSNVWTLEFINRNQLLIGSTDGIFRLYLDDRLEIASIKKLDRQDGHKGGEVFLGSMIKTGDKIWFGTGKGAYSYQIENNAQVKKGPRTFIKEVEITNHREDKAAVAKGIYGLPENLKINYGDTRLKFSFFATDFYDNQNIQYRYYLGGMENDWSKYSNVNQITYSNLKPGKYNFRVQSLGESMMLGSVADYPFEVLPAFWQTISFKVFATALTFFSLVFAVRNISFRRLRQYRLTEEIRASEIGKIRKQMAMDFHDEMGNKLAGILAYINSLKFRASNVATEELVSYLEENATAIYHGTKDFIWSIDMESNNLREVISYLRDFGVNFFEKHKIEFIIEKDILNTTFNRPLADGQNRHIILLFKEAMTNVLKHSKCSKVYFDALVLGKQCQITLEDNGIGFCDNGKGKGIRSMKERASRINGIVKFLKRQPRGTRIVLEFAV